MAPGHLGWRSPWLTQGPSSNSGHRPSAGALARMAAGPSLQFDNSRESEILQKINTNSDPDTRETPQSKTKETINRQAAQTPGYLQTRLCSPPWGGSGNPGTLPCSSPGQLPPGAGTLLRDTQRSFQRPVGPTTQLAREDAP